MHHNPLRLGNKSLYYLVTAMAVFNMSIGNEALNRLPIATLSLMNIQASISLLDSHLLYFNQTRSVRVQLESLACSRSDEPHVAGFDELIVSDWRLWTLMGAHIQGWPQGHSPGVSLLKWESEAVKVWHMSYWPLALAAQSSGSMER